MEVRRGAIGDMFRGMCTRIAVTALTVAAGCGGTAADDLADDRNGAATPSQVGIGTERDADDADTEPDADTNAEPEPGSETRTGTTAEPDADSDGEPEIATTALSSCQVDRRYCGNARRLALVRSVIYGPPFTESPAEIEAMMAEAKALEAEWARLAPDEIRPLIELTRDEFSDPIDDLTEQLGWDPYAAINTDEVLAIFEDPEVNAAIAELDAYAARCCACREDLTAPTDPVIFRDRSIAVYNGTPSLNRALTWALERFEAAGLALPTIGSATFTVQSTICDDARGRYTATPEGIELELCMDEGRMCWEDPDADPFGCAGHCPVHLPGMMAVVLHELAHAWLDAHMDTIDTDAFLEHVGVESWRDRDSPWIERGVEHAADTIAWGLMDRDIEMLRIGQPDAEELADGFRLLTGIEPLPKRD